jgi:hypothetical protein
MRFAGIWNWRRSYEGTLPHRRGNRSKGAFARDPEGECRVSRTSANDRTWVSNIVASAIHGRNDWTANEAWTAQ